MSTLAKIKTGEKPVSGREHSAVRNAVEDTS